MATAVPVGTGPVGTDDAQEVIPEQVAGALVGTPGSGSNQQQQSSNSGRL